MNPLISVIIPSFNRLKYLDEAIMSVLEQDYKEVEIIIVFVIHKLLLIFYKTKGMKCEKIDFNVDQFSEQHLKVMDSVKTFKKL